ncbi:MAG: SMP-30/gluconolactonase/LRE family protein [Gammaproteobacteria bacterium]|nr:SMP-30/gluconolactonase/LRE family protein [Gammaproteobacteria bacterium]
MNSLLNKNLVLALLFLAALTACSPEKSGDEGQSGPDDAGQAQSSTDTTDQGEKPATGVSCTGSKGLTPYCGFKNPEDIVLVPDGKQLIVSEMGEFMMDSPGSLSLFDLAGNRKLPIHIDWQVGSSNWGQAECSAPDPILFSPHGIDLVQRADGAHSLLVVNHGGRESVEMFELANTAGTWSLSWRGCVLPPEDPFINDVSGLNNGGLLVTHMWNKSLTMEQITEKFSKGENLGWVWEWHPDNGFSKLAGSDQLMPNGIAVSKDNTKVYVNIYLGNKTIKIDKATGTIEATFEVRQPDNVVLDNDGILWVASHQHDPINENCNDVKEGPCLLPFAIVRADSETMAAQTVLTRDGEPMGYATVAFPAGDRLFMGSAHGDRIVSVPITQVNPIALVPVADAGADTMATEEAPSQETTTEEASAEEAPVEEASPEAPTEP